MLFLDLRKAFDIVDHSLLSSKLQKTGINHEYNNWFTSYLEGRLQVTKLGGIFSQPRMVTFGVPQGTILGALLFTLYVNDLPLSNSQFDTYDTAIVVSSDNFLDLESNLNLALKNKAD